VVCPNTELPTNPKPLPNAMNVAQLITRLQTLPPEATVLLEGEFGYSPLGDLSLQAGEGGLPDEVLLQPDMTPD